MKTKYKWYKRGGSNRIKKVIVIRRTSSPETSALTKFKGGVILLKGGKSK